MELKQIFLFKRVFILTLFSAQPAKAVIFDSWRMFVKEKFISENRQNTHQLFEAVKSGDKDKALTALNRQADVNARDKEKKTPLHWAVYNNDILMAEFLLQKDADPNAVTRRRKTPLHEAVLKPSIDLTLLLLENGAKPNIKDQEHWTPLHWLAIPQKKRREYLDIRKKSSENLQKEHQQPSYWDERDLEKTRLLLDYKADSNLEDLVYKTPLHYVIMFERLEMAKLLIQKGADVNAQDLMYDTPLHLISKKKKLKNHSLAIARILLQNGANPNALNIRTIVPMKFSIDNKTYELQEILKQFGGKLLPQNFCMRLFRKKAPAE